MGLSLTPKISDSGPPQGFTFTSIIGAPGLVSNDSPEGPPQCLRVALLPQTRIAYADDHGEHWTFPPGAPNANLVDWSDPIVIVLDGRVYDTDLRLTNIPYEEKIRDLCERGFLSPWEHACFIQGKIYGVTHGVMWEYDEAANTWRCRMPEKPAKTLLHRAFGPRSRLIKPRAIATGGIRYGQVSARHAMTAAERLHRGR